MKEIIDESFLVASDKCEKAGITSDIYDYLIDCYKCGCFEFDDEEEIYKYDISLTQIEDNQYELQIDYYNYEEENLFTFVSTIS